MTQPLPRLAGTTIRPAIVLLPLVLLALVLLAPASRAQAQPAPSGAGQTTLLTRAELGGSGLLRLRDVLAERAFFDGYSMAGYTGPFALGALGPAGQTGWTVLVDGLPYGLDVFGASDLAVLPVPLAQIDSVEVVARPVVAAGAWRPGGVLHIRTRPPDPGLTAEASFGAGNETGDPGPYRYTEAATPNIDRTGPDFAGRLAYRGGPWRVEATGWAAQQHGTDARIIRRVRDLYRGVYNARFLLGGGGLRAERTTDRAALSATASASRFHNLRFSELAGQELPVSETWAQAGLTGRHAWQDLRYHVRAHGVDLGPRPNRLDLDYDWREAHVEAAAEVQRGAWTLGPRLSYRRAASASLTADAGLLRAGGQGGYRREVPEDRRAVGLVEYYGRLVATGGDGGVGVAVLGGGLYRMAARTLLRLDATASAEPPAAHPDRSLWIARGYDHPLFAPAPAALSSSGRRMRATADLSLLHTFGAALELTLSGRLRYLPRLPVEDVVFDFEAQTDGFRPRARFSTARGGLGGGGIDLRHRPGRRFEHHLYAHADVPFEADGAFERAWSSLPRLRAGYRARLAPNARFHLAGSLRYASATRWAAFAPADAATGGRYPDRLAARWLARLSAEKLFWDDHVRASLALQNLLDTRRARTHPAGAVDRLALFVHLAVHLDR